MFSFYFGNTRCVIVKSFGVLEARGGIFSSVPTTYFDLGGHMIYQNDRVDKTDFFLIFLGHTVINYIE